MFQVDENFFRGPRPESLNDIVDNGITTIVSLQSGLYELTHEDDYENAQPADYGIKFYDLGCSDFTPPTPRVVQKVLQILAKGERTYVHCLAGKDRTGFVTAVYRMHVNDWSYSAAVAEMENMGFHWWYFWWKRELKKYADK